MATQIITIIPPVIAHRGCAYAPENTLAAMRAAKEAGAAWVEFDVMLAGCGEAIIIHDSKLNRTTNGTGEVGETPYSEIQALDAGSWFSEEFSGERIPTFIEMMACMDELGLSANVEIKPYPGQYHETAETALKLAEAHWPSNIAKPLFSSFSVECLEVVRELGEDAMLGLICDDWSLKYLDVAKELACVSIHVDEKFLTDELIGMIKKTGMQLFAYVVNDQARAKDLFALGVDAVFTDYPDKILNPENNFKLNL